MGEEGGLQTSFFVCLNVGFQTTNQTQVEVLSKTISEAAAARGTQRPSDKMVSDKASQLPICYSSSLSSTTVITLYIQPYPENIL